MEKLLALFFSDDYLEAAVQPKEDKFSVISQNDGNRYYFYFKVNPYSMQIDSGADYEKKFRDRQGLFLGDLIKNIEEGKSFNVENFSGEYITLFDCIIKSVRDLYAEKLKISENSFSISDATVINAAAVFSDNISENAKKKITDYFLSKNIVINSTQSLDCLAVKYFAKEKGLFCQNRTFAVLEALGGNLNMSVVKADNKTFSRGQFRQFKGYGIDPMVKVIAEKIVGSANLTGHLINKENQEELNTEIIRHYDKAKAVIRHFEQNAEKHTIKISTAFACNPDHKISVTLSFDDLKQTASDISRQYPAMFTNSFLSGSEVKISTLENVILIGDTLGNPSVLQEFNTLAGTKIRHFSDTEAENFLKAVFETEPLPAAEIQDEEATAFMFGNQEEEKPPVIQQQPVIQQPVYKEITELNINSLAPGKNVYIDTFDPTPGKGAAFQEFEFTGGRMFKVLSSGRSLKPGDMVQTVFDVWKLEMQLDFLVTRGAKNLGKFRTRIVKKIRVK